MEFNYRFHGSSAVADTAQSTALGFAPDTLREPTFFVAELAQHLLFREAISALNAVVVSDLRFKPKDRSDYMQWLQEQEAAMLAEFLQGQGDIKVKVKAVRSELDALYKETQALMTPYYRAQQKYFNHLYKTDYDAWFVLDPVISVHPDEVFFECFSQDESSYGKLSCDYSVFGAISEQACGTTNIDYSAALYNEFQKIRDYKKTQFAIDPAGFEVASGNEDNYREEKIDLPESWVRGFLQVSSAMTLPMKTVELHPMDVHNICFMLRRRKERQGPRSLRFILKPGQPLKIVFEPWNQELNCPRSAYHGREEDEIRIWGRRRLLILERLIPIATRFTVHLLGSGLPSFFVADLGPMRFTLGLSGWTANDWSRMGNFDLMAPRAAVDELTQTRIFNALKETWQESADSLAARLGLQRQIVLGALSAYTQAGRVIYDMDKDVYRLRELSRDPLPLETLRFDNPREANANNFVKAKLVSLKRAQQGVDMLTLSGTVMDNAKTHTVQMSIDSDMRLRQASCSCDYFVHNRLYKGPCEHMLALRIYHRETAG